MTYHEIESGYIRKLIRSTNWNSHEKIDDLIRLHSFIQHPPTNFVGGMHYSWLMSAYSSQYLELLHEFSKAEYEKEIVRQQEKSLAESKLIKDRLSIEMVRRKAWLEAGGQF